MASSKSFRPKVFMGRQNLSSSGTTSEHALNRQFNASLGDILENLNDFVAHMDNVSADILVEVLEPTFGKAIEYCPKDSHDLVNSAYLESEKFRGGARAMMGFGKGGKPTYAIYVHEMPYQHAAPTRSKFLEAALDEDYFTILKRIPQVVREFAGT